MGLIKKEIYLIKNGLLNNHSQISIRTNANCILEEWICQALGGVENGLRINRKNEAGDYSQGLRMV